MVIRHSVIELLAKKHCYEADEIHSRILNEEIMLILSHIKYISNARIFP